MKVLIIDDDIRVGNAVKRMLKLQGITDGEVENDPHAGEEKMIGNTYDIVLLDLIMPEKNGYDVLVSAKAAGCCSAVIILTAVEEIPMVVKCIKAGAFDYLVKPVDNELLAAALKKAFEHMRLSRSIALFTSRKELEKPAVFDGFYTQDINTIKIMLYAEQLAALECNILLTGETGAGKEIFARAIHAMSARGGQAFVPVNTTAIPKNLFESTLFGHKKGAFTTATEDRSGLCLRADGGTLFLDEIGSMDMECQAKILRLIEEKQFYPVGSDAPVSSDFRLICATNKDLIALMEQDRFRRDLYYRIKSTVIYIPPIRERGRDIIFLAGQVLDGLSRKHQREKVLTADAEQALLVHPFPGNYRELRQVIESAFFSNDAHEVTAEDIVFDVCVGAEDKTDFTFDCIKKDHIQKVLQLHTTKKDAASALGVTYNQLYKLIKKYKLE